MDVTLRKTRAVSYARVFRQNVAVLPQHCDRYDGGQATACFRRGEEKCDHEKGEEQYGDSTTHNQPPVCLHTGGCKIKTWILSNRCVGIRGEIVNAIDAARVDAWIFRGWNDPRVFRQIDALRRFFRR